VEGALTEPQPRKKPRRKFFRSHDLEGRAREAGVVKPGSSAAGSGTSMKKAVRLAWRSAWYLASTWARLRDRRTTLRATELRRSEK